MAAADLDADAASQQEPQLVLLHGVGRREGACPPRVRDCSPGLQPEWRVGCAGAPHLLRLTAWELARRQRSHLRAGASQLRARAGAGHGARSVLLIDDAGALAPRPGGVAPADDQQHLHAALAALISLACAGDAPRGRTVRHFATLWRPSEPEPVVYAALRLGEPERQSSLLLGLGPHKRRQRAVLDEDVRVLRLT